MTISEVISALRSRFATAWGVTTPVQYPNMSFDPARQAPQGEFVRFSVKFGKSTIGENIKGGAGWRNGIIICDVIIAASKISSDARALALASLIEPIFQMEVIDGKIIIDQPDTNCLSDADGYYIASVSFPFKAII